MDVFISADIEGCTGVVSWGAQAAGPGSKAYDWPFARRMMTHDVNAAIRGARAAGANRVLVKDSHNTFKNLLIEELEPGTELISGSGAGSDGMMQGIDESFGCAFLVGYHGRAGAPKGVMDHSYSGSARQLSINGQEAGEIWFSAATASLYGVPIAMVVSDEAGCNEAIDLLPGVVPVCTKFGLGRYMARLLHPSQTGPLIEEAAARAVRQAKGATWSPSPPFETMVEWRKPEEADAVEAGGGWSRESSYRTTSTDPDWPTLHRKLMVAFGRAGASYHADL